MLKTDDFIAFGLTVPQQMRASRIGHVVEAVAFGLGRRTSCSCGAEVSGPTDADMAEAFRVHRRDSPPDTPRLVVKPGSGQVGITLPGTPRFADQPA